MKAFDFNIETYHQIDRRYSYLMDDANRGRWVDEISFESITHLIEPLIERWVHTLLYQKPRSVGFYLTTGTRLMSLLLARRIKECDRQVRIIFGGPDCFQEKYRPCLIQDDAVDAIVIGEGEATLGEMLRAFWAGEEDSEYDGAIIKKEGRILLGKDRPLISSLDRLPMPDFGDFPLEQYRFDQGFPILTSRGCIQRCRYCHETAFWRHYRSRSAESVFRELKARVEQGFDNFHFHDSIINGDLDELSRLCDLIIESGLDISWGGYAAARPEMDLQFFMKLKKAGYRNFNCGADSGEQSILTRMNKRQDLSVVERNIRDARRAGIFTNINFIVGFPGETYYSFLATLGFIFRNREHINQIGSLNAFYIEPISEIGRNTERFGIVCAPGRMDEWRSLDGRNTYPRRLRMSRLLGRFAGLLGIKVCSFDEYKYLYGLCNHYIEEKNYKKALRLVERQLKKEPGNAYLLFKKGLILRQVGNEQESRAFIKKATALDPFLSS